MRIILSPAKQMVTDTDSLACTGQPRFLPRAERLLAALRAMTPQQRRTLWHCSDKIAAENEQRLRTADLRRGLTPALLAYDGIQYKTMAPGVFTAGQLDYVGQYLRILSGFYGILRPFDGVRAYRLEMQARICLEDGGRVCRDLYAFWGDSLYKEVTAEDKVIVNLASKEYSRAVEPFLEPGIAFVQVVFGSLEADKRGEEKIKVKATEAKMARGEMVRFLARTGAETPEDMKKFDGLGFAYSRAHSGENTYVFLR